MPLLDSTPGWRHARSRNRQTRTHIVIREDHGRFDLSCEEHGSRTLAWTWSDACEVARRPRSWCSECERMPAAAPRAPRRRRSTGAAGGRRLGLGRRFGIEIEFYGIRRLDVERWLGDSGLGNAGWRIKSDGSVSGPDGIGLELVSPPLTGEDGLAQVRTACEWLNANGAAVNRTCGLHIHLDVRDCGADGIKRFARSYHNNQDLINFLVSPSRRDGMYCRPLAGVMAQVERCRERYEFGRVHRYHAVNVAAFPRHGTVELRQHQGTLSFRKIEAWLKFGQGMLDTVAERGVPLVDQGGIRSLMDAAQVDEDAAAFLIGRAVQFGAGDRVMA